MSGYSTGDQRADKAFLVGADHGRTSERERIALAIEAERDDPTFDHGHWMEGEDRGMTLAAQIARGGESA